MKYKERGFKPEKSIKLQRNNFDAQNLRCAREILATPERHGGPDAFPAIWAGMVITRLGSGTQASDTAANSPTPASSDLNPAVLGSSTDQPRLFQSVSTGTGL